MAAALSLSTMTSYRLSFVSMAADYLFMHEAEPKSQSENFSQSVSDTGLLYNRWDRQNLGLNVE